MSKTLIIAEAGVNHNGDIEMAKRLVDVAVDAGADIVKFQSFRADKLASKDAPKAEYQIANADQGESESQYDMLKRLELSDEGHEILIKYCAEKGIEFLSTPFDVDGVDMLTKQFGLKTIKLGSSELTNGPILLAAAQTGCPVIFSTGMGDLAEIREALDVLAYGYTHEGAPTSRSDFKGAFKGEMAAAIVKEKVTILHCTTAYPTPFEDVNLRAMKTIEDTFGVPVGYSDHTLGISVPIAAVAMGAKVIEKHFTLDKTLPGPDHKASLEPEDLKAMVTAIREIESSLGCAEKITRPAESVNKSMARKSLVAAANLNAGDILDASNMTIKRPGEGTSPMLYWDALGKPANRDYKNDEVLKVEC